MQIKWSLYPHSGLVNHALTYPWPLNEYGPAFVSFLSPVWDAEIQMYVTGYLGEVIANRFPLEQLFNSSFDIDMHFLGDGEFCLEHLTLRQLAEMNCKLHVHHCPC